MSSSLQPPGKRKKDLGWSPKLSVTPVFGVGSAAGPENASGHERPARPPPSGRYWEAHATHWCGQSLEPVLLGVAGDEGGGEPMLS